MHNENALTTNAAASSTTRCLVLRVFTVAERNIDGQRNAAFALCLIDSTDLAAVFGEKLVEPVLDARNIAVSTVGVDGVKNGR